VQGTAAYTLIVAQDSGDPENGLPGYFNIELTDLSQRAQTFTLENQFIRSSFPQNTQIPFGVSSFTYTTTRGGH